MIPMRIFLLLSTAVLFGYQGAYAQTTPATNDQLRLSRLQTLADIWSKLYLTHPAVFTNHLSFENVLMEAIPAVENAGSPTDFVQALNETVFDPLRDPLAFAQVLDAENETPFTGIASAKMTRIAPGVLMLDATDQRVYSDPDVINRMNALLKEVRPRDTLVVDLRWQKAQAVYFHPGLWLRLFVNSSLPSGNKVSRQMVQRSDIILNTESSVWGFANNSFVVEASMNVDPARHGKTEPGWSEELMPINFDSLVTVNNDVYFIVNNTSFPSVGQTLDAMQGQDNVRIVWDKTGNFIDKGAWQDYPEKIRVNLDCNMLVSRNGYAGVSPDAVYPVSQTDIQLLEDVRGGISRRVPADGAKPFSYSVGRTLLQKLGNASSREQRITALMKIWMIVNYLSPHLENATMDWKNMLTTWIPEVEKAETIPAYVLTLERVLSGLHDSHYGVWGKSVFPYNAGDYLPPLRLQMVEGRVIVTEIASDSVKRFVKMGDEVKSLDDRSIEEISDHWRQIYSASSEQAFIRWLWSSPLAITTRGKQNSLIRMSITSKRKPEVVTLVRSVKMPWPTKGKVMSKRMPGNIGYICHYLIPTTTMRDSIIDSYANTDGLLIDLRGRPRISIFDLATYFSKEPIPDAKFEYPQVSFVGGQVVTGTIQEPQHYFLPGLKHQYGKPVVVLIDANMQSHSESAAMLLRNTGHVTLVGSRTTGTTGSAIPFAISDELDIAYTSMKVSNIDGSKFQNIGVIPDVFIEPTIKGIMAGRDEVLEKGMAVLREKIEGWNAHK